jgi:pilus assembly protein CpaC
MSNRFRVIRFARWTAAAVVSAVAIGLVPTPLGAQNQAAPPQTAASARLPLTTGRSTVLTTDFDVVRIAVTNPAIADAVVVSPREVLVDGKGPGTVSLIIWGATSRVQYDVVVDLPVSQLQEQLRTLFPGENIIVTENEEATTLSGNVSSNEIMLKAGEIATRNTKSGNVINLLQVPGGLGSQQVLLQVRFAEVNRNALLEAGINLFTGPQGYKDWVGRVTTGQFTAPSFTGDLGPGGSGQLSFGDFLNLFLFNTKYDIGGVVRALQTKGLLQSLAEPNLIAYNGKEASFLAGGEVPVPVVQGGTSNAVTIVYREYGIRLNFTPTIAGDFIRLHVKPEVSSLDFPNGVTLGGFRIPALQTRRAETEVELRDGQSFAIAGLLNNVSQNDKQQIPLIGSLPIIGNLFKSKSFSQSRTELMVLITPRLVKPLDPDEVPALPTMNEQFLQDAPTAAESGGAPGK